MAPETKQQIVTDSSIPQRRVNEEDFERFSRLENTLTKKVQRQDDQIRSLRKEIRNGYRLVPDKDDAGEQKLTPKGRNKRRRSTLRNLDIDRLRVRLVETETGRTELYHALVDARKKLRGMNQTMKRFGRLGKKIVLEQRRAVVNQQRFIERTVKNIEKQLSSETSKLPDQIRQDFESNPQDASRTIFSVLAGHHTALFEVFKSRPSLRAPLIEHFFKTPIPANFDTTDPSLLQ